MKFEAKGKCSWFGGPSDTGVSSSEQLAFLYDTTDQPSIFLSYQPTGTTGLARRLNPDTFYLACRWPYTADNKAEWREALIADMAKVTATKTGRSIKCYPSDWGPAGPESDHDTGRVADLSPAALEYLGITTDDEVTIVWPFTHRRPEVAEGKLRYKSIFISSGHGKYVRGASGVVDEVDEARKITEALATELRGRGVTVKTFHDDTSHDQSTNLATIVNAHNTANFEMNCSIHLNAYVETSSPMGVEVLFVTQSALAEQLSAAIASLGFINRGPKKRTDLYFLNQTTGPAILVEQIFCDSQADCDLYRARFDAIIDQMATCLSGKAKAKPKPEPKVA